MEALFIQARQAGKCIAGLSDDFRNDVLRAVADELVSSKEELLRANAEDLARMAGVRRETIGNLEKGKYNPSLVLAWKIAEVFKVTIEDIFTVEEE